MNSENNRIVRASEVGLYTYCARAWWLSQVKGHRSAHRAAMATGEAAHQTHGRAVVGYHRLRQTAYALLGLALLTAGIVLVALLLR